MTTATPVDAPVTTPLPPLPRRGTWPVQRSNRPPAPDSTDALGEEIAVLAARLHAVTYELLLLLHEFDGRNGWNNGFCVLRTLAALAHRHRLGRRPRKGSRGAISYATVRALTRVATVDNEATLLQFAQAATASQVERFVGAWRRVDGVAAAEAETRHLGRHLSTFVDDEGMVVIRGRLTPEVGAVVQRALEAAADRLFREAQTEPKTERPMDEVTPVQRRADALGLLAEVALSSDLDRGSAGDRYQVVLHMDAPSDAPAAGGPTATMELDHGPQYVSAETSRRLSCDASVVRMQHASDGAVLDVGRKTRTVPPSIRRALEARDRSCRFPGCTSRRCDAHHVEHWVDGGETSLNNLVLLCRRHHRAVHEGRFEVRSHKDGAVSFLRPHGVVIEPAPTLPESLARIDITPWKPDDIPVWDGTRFDVVYAIDVLYAWQVADAAMRPA